MRYLLIVAACMFIFQANGQCRGFAKTNCKESLGGYVSTGETNTSELKPGEKHQFMATFYKGQHYRIAICSDESLGNMQFTIRNAKRQLYFDNHGEKISSFDFKVASTQQLIISLIAPENNAATEENTEESKEEISGCVSAITGFRL